MPPQPDAPLSATAAQIALAVAHANIVLAVKNYDKTKSRFRARRHHFQPVRARKSTGTDAEGMEYGLYLNAICTVLLCKRGLIATQKGLKSNEKGAKKRPFSRFPPCLSLHTTLLRPHTAVTISALRAARPKLENSAQAPLPSAEPPFSAAQKCKYHTKHPPLPHTNCRRYGLRAVPRKLPSPYPMWLFPA